MYQISENCLKLPGSHLFSTIAKRVAVFTGTRQGGRVIRMGIGDAMKPLYLAVIQALHKAVDEMGEAETFRGCELGNGYVFLRDKTVRFDYEACGAEIRSNEIFIPDGAKNDSGSIQEIFSLNSVVTVCDPVYPVYLDTDVMAGRSGDYDAAKGIYAGATYLPYTVENDFTPTFPAGRASDLIHFRSPNNPTDAAMREEALQRWADYVNRNGSVILFDAAYEVYITEIDVPHTIYECGETETCAIEPRSFSKEAGFMGLHLDVTVVPRDLRKKMKRTNGTTEEVELHVLWSRHHGTKFSGTPYIMQRAGEVVCSVEGQREAVKQVAYYMRSAHYIYETLKKAGFSVYDDVNVPYVWVRTFGDMTSWEFFDTLLEKAVMIGTPGPGLGPHGEHCFRFPAFGAYEDMVEAAARTQALRL